MALQPSPGQRLRRSLWASVAFLAGFAILITVIAHMYLLPALEAAHGADQSGKKQISAMSALLLAVLLVCLVTALAMTFRVRRFFFPRGKGSRSRTEYVDAWSESSKRMNSHLDRET